MLFEFLDDCFCSYSFWRSIAACNDFAAIKKKTVKEKYFFTAQKKAMELQYQELRKDYERHRHLVHDEKHILSYLKECILKGNDMEALTFLDDSKERMESGSSSFQTGITTLDFMLNSKKRKMDKLGIQFKLRFQISEIPMEDADFVVVLGNRLDNAIEAVGKCTPENRKIWMSIQDVNDMFFLCVKNTYQTAPRRKKDRFITHKSEIQNHGLGIESVKRIMEKYQGEVYFSYNYKVFEAKCMIF